MLTDYHSHFLPAMDDGPEDTQTALRMLAVWREQGIERIVATPHFYPHRESAESFLARREKTFRALNPASDLPHILLGAEVRVEQGICELEQIRALTLAGSKHILVEFPYAPFKEWMLAEVCNLAYHFGLIPVLAHIDRYVYWYSADDFSRVLSIREAVLQINNEAVLQRKTQKLALELVRGGFPVVFGSDAHNLEERPPNCKSAYQVLQAKLRQPEMLSLIKLNKMLIM